MRGLLVIWLLCGGIGVSYSILSERRKRLELFKSMEEDIKKLAYYMCDWHMPVEEVLGQMGKEEGPFAAFYIRMQKIIQEKQTEAFGKLWQEESRKMPLLATATEEVRTLWAESFLQMPIEPEALRRRLMQCANNIEKAGGTLEEKYKGEQRLVVSLGFFVSAFLCLILW